MKQSTNISLIQIILTLTLFFSIPYVIVNTNIYVQNITLTSTFIIHTISLIMVTLKFKVLEEHFMRFSRNIKDCLLFTFIGILLLVAISAINIIWLHAPVWIPEHTVLADYSLFSIIIILAYTYTYACIFVLAFKSATDRLKVKSNEAIIILISALAFGLFTASSYLIVDNAYFIPYLIYYSVVSLVTSYTYNQTNSLAPMIVAYGTVMLLLCYL